MDYNFIEIEKKWQQYWVEKQTYKVDIDTAKPKFYVLDMFPYPSGAGLHVGHPLGYIASDIFSRYKRLKGFNVLHPMGYDAFGLPAEQYAIQTGQHPEVTTSNNIARYREQLDKLGFSFDWSREVRTSDPKYYKWTQWTFIQLFKSFYNNKTNKAEAIDNLIKEFETNGTANIDAASHKTLTFDAQQWKDMNEKEQQQVLMNYRLAYLSETAVNWCQELGTVLANDEVKEGYSVRGGHPVERRMMNQWLLRITAYNERLLYSLDTLDWTDSLKDMQRYWIGKSEGATVFFQIKGFDDKLEIFTTRPDTLFGCTFMVIAPEHYIIDKITPADHKQQVNDYINIAKNRSERERQADVKTISGVFTGAYCKHPFTGKDIPIWVADYVLAGYGTGAVMSVPAHDSRDWAFARHFNISLAEVVAGGDITKESYDAKSGILINSDFLNGMQVKEAIKFMISKLEYMKIGYMTVNYRLRDAIFSRQRYWGEPFPVYYKNDIPYPFDESELPLELPQISSFLPSPTGEPPLARADNWTTKAGYPIETSTMPGFAGSCAYYFRYMDPHNDKEYFSKDAVAYWQNVDLYIGGAEHATGHLMYARFWNKFLFDIGLTPQDEPFSKLINQGMIQGRSSIMYKIKGTNRFVSLNLKDDYETYPVYVDISIVNNDLLDTEAFRRWQPDYANAEFILEEGKYVCGYEIDKMSKSKYNVVNPDELVEKYGADTLRMYEMFLGPLEQHKPWDTKGIEGVFRFIRKFWKLYHDNNNTFAVTADKPNAEELKVLHKTIKKLHDDINRYSFNTGVSNFMICVNELSALKCNKQDVLEPLAILISPYAPHIAEELWSLLGHTESITTAAFPEHDEAYLKESTYAYPVSFNGKMRFTLELPIDMPREQIEIAVLTSEDTKKWLAGTTPKKIIVVPNKIINIVI